MKTSLKIFLTLISLAVCTAGSLTRAADAPAPAPTAPTTAKPHGAFVRLQAQLQPLNLTDDQKAKVDAIILEAEKSAADLRKDKEATKEVRQAGRQALRQATLDKIRAVLTPEQAANFSKHGKGKVKAEDKAEGKPEDASAP